jgi:hypothetical protein
MEMQASITEQPQESGARCGHAPSQAAQIVTAEPKHPLHAMTTYELRDYRRQLEQAIAFFDKQDPVPPARGGLQASLDAVLTEQDERARIAHAS